MISEELKMIVDKFKKQGKMNFLKATTEEKIASFEKENKIASMHSGYTCANCIGNIFANSFWWN